MILRSFVILVLLVSVSLGQFESGTITAGSLFSFSSVDGGGGGDPTNVTTIGTNSLSFYSFTIRPMVGYFILDNLSLDLLFSRTGIKEDDWEYTMMHYGPGASFYASNVYLGGGYVLMSNSGGSSTSKSNYIEAHGGFLFELSQNVFLDANVSYLMGTGDDVYETDDGYTDEDPNDASVLNVSVGVKGFFKL